MRHRIMAAIVDTTLIHNNPSIIEFDVEDWKSVDVIGMIIEEYMAIHGDDSTANLELRFVSMIHIEA